MLRYALLALGCISCVSMHTQCSSTLDDNCQSPLRHKVNNRPTGANLTLDNFLNEHCELVERTSNPPTRLWYGDVVDRFKNEFDSNGYTRIHRNTLARMFHNLYTQQAIASMYHREIQTRDRTLHELHTSYRDTDETKQYWKEAYFKLRSHHANTPLIWGCVGGIVGFLSCALLWKFTSQAASTSVTS